MEYNKDSKVEYIKYEEPNLPNIETYQDNFEFGKSIEKLDPNIHIKTTSVEPVVADIMEYAICPASATCVLPLSSHIIPLDFTSSETNDTGMIATPNQITITKAGTYMVTGSIIYKNIVTSGAWRGINPRKNGNRIARDEISPRTSFTYTNATGMTRCVVGDVIDMIGLVDATACVDIDEGTGNSFLHVARLSD